MEEEGKHKEGHNTVNKCQAYNVRLGSHIAHFRNP